MNEPVVILERMPTEAECEMWWLMGTNVSYLDGFKKVVKNLQIDPATEPVDYERKPKAERREECDGAMLVVALVCGLLGVMLGVALMSGLQ